MSLRIPRLGPEGRPAVPPGDPRRWLTCAVCSHLRIEHHPRHGACEVQLDGALCLCHKFRVTRPVEVKDDGTA